MAKRITRKQMKQDRFVSSVFKGYGYAKKHTNQLITIAIVIVVVVVGLIAFSSYRKSRQNEAVDLLGMGMLAYRQGNYTEARDTLAVLVDRFSGTESGKVGTYYLGHLRLLLGEYDESINNLNSYLANPLDDPDLKAAAQSMLAACYEEKGEFQRAAELYFETYQQYPLYFESSSNMLNAARCYKQVANLEKAEELYRLFLEKYPEAPQKQDVLLNLAEIESQRGELSMGVE
ncbi:tetratricopeptide repeat protein [bacterium]|nr:tetratricopeptide repeat protein [bacterium]